MMKWWWTEGWNEMQTPIIRECWTFLIYIFLHQERKQCLEFALPKPGEICKHLACAYNSALSILFEGGEGTLRIEFTNIATK